MAPDLRLDVLRQFLPPDPKPMFNPERSDEWLQNWGLRSLETCGRVAEADCRILCRMVLELQQDDLWQRMFPTWEECCEKGFGRTAAWIEAICNGMALLLQTNPQAATQPVTPTAVQKALDLTGTFAKPGDNQYTRPSGDDNVNTMRGSTGLGNSADYLAARLKKAGRDDLLEQVRDGAIRSVRAAAIEAGIVKDVPVVRLTSPEKAAAAIRRHWSSEQVQALCTALSSTC
jgi:hypothetical protein